MWVASSRLPHKGAAKNGASFWLSVRGGWDGGRKDGPKVTGNSTRARPFRR